MQRTLVLNKDIMIKDGINSSKRMHSSQKASKKPKMRNTNMNTWDRIGNKNVNNDFPKRLSTGTKLDRTKSESSNIQKEYSGDLRDIAPLNEATSDDRDKGMEKIMERPPQNKIYRKTAQQAKQSLFVAPEIEWNKEQERMIKLRKKVTEKYNFISANLKANSENEAYKYIIMKGNNSSVITRCMRNRLGWEETADFNTMFNFRWQQTSYGIKFGQLSMNGKKQMVNHFENHEAITTKDNLFKNLSEFLDTKVFDFVPLTVWIQSYSENYFKDLNNFKSIFNTWQQYESK